VNVLVLGPTGGTGREIVKQALERSHVVTAFVRDPGKLAIGHPRLRVVKGSVPEDVAALEGAVSNQDAVISALGRGNGLNPGGLMARSVPAIVGVMEKRGVRRIIFVSAFGVGETIRDAPFLPRLMHRTMLAGLFADKLAGEQILRRSGLDWTIVYPTILTNGPRTSRYRHGERLELRGLPRISRADVAEFVLKQLGEERLVKKGVVVSD
jgi:putative NADH-flavin reductase